MRKIDADGAGAAAADHYYNVSQGDNAVLEIHDVDGVAAGSYTPHREHRYMVGSAVDEILASEDASGAVLWGLGDNEGTIRDIVSNATRQSVEHRKYDSFGNKTSTSLSQWASSVVAVSSERFPAPNWWSSTQATRAPDLTVYEDGRYCWSPAKQNGTTEFITLGYATPVYANGVTIRENWGNGFVTKIEVRNAATGVFETVWQGTDPSQPGSVVDFVVDFDQRTYLVDAVRITTDTNHNLSTSEEIDAVQLRGAVDFAFGYTGQAEDATTGLIDCGHRWYDPAVGRFASEDPSGFDAGDLNLYRYVGNNPINQTDPTGLCGSSNSWSVFSSNQPLSVSDAIRQSSSSYSSGINYGNLYLSGFNGAGSVQTSPSSSSAYYGLGVSPVPRATVTTGSFINNNLGNTIHYAQSEYGTEYYDDFGNAVSYDANRRYFRQAGAVDMSEPGTGIMALQALGGVGAGPAWSVLGAASKAIVSGSLGAAAGTQMYVTNQFAQASKQAYEYGDIRTGSQYLVSAVGSAGATIGYTAGALGTMPTPTNKSTTPKVLDSSNFRNVSDIGIDLSTVRAPLDTFPYEASRASAVLSASTRPGTYVYVRDLNGTVQIVPDAPHMLPRSWEMRDRQLVQAL